MKEIVFIIVWIIINFIIGLKPSDKKFWLIQGIVCGIYFCIF